ncbi:MAG: aspartate aminotransferase family protein [Opitutales bacterium]|nr:aspartate aminotransferase family protein [Opitutales bacterium]
MKISEKYEKYTVGNYGKRSISLAKGKGSYVWDENGKKYLDFGAGIAVLSLGHCHKRLVDALSKQASTLGHCSNLYMHAPQADAAEKLVKIFGEGKVFFCNSGAEANEALLKAARLNGKKLTGEEGKKYRVLVAVNGFHGRTLGTLSATAQEKIQKGFSPLMPKFSYATFNDAKSFEKLMGDDVAAVLVEPVQGESGVLPATKEFLKGLRALCDKYGAMLLFDEVQCGAGRLGTFAAFKKFGVKPDAISMAKGLGGGFPIGAIWLSKKYQDLFAPGSHGTTFGGNPLACAAANAVLDEIKSKDLLKNVAKTGKILLGGLKKIAKKYPQKIKLARGMGLMIGVLFNDDVKNTDACAALVKNGLILVPAGSNALRFLPPLNVKESEINSALKIFEKTISEL